MISKVKIKYIQSLHKKKNRESEKVFIVEGNKMVTEVLKSDYKVQLLCASSQYIYNHNEIINKNTERICVDALEMKKISLLQNPQEALAIVYINRKELNIDKLENELTIVLDCIQDPGNLGTIIRTADWFGIKDIVCSIDTVECFNPKVIQSSMGAILRINIHYVDLLSFLKQTNEIKIPSYGTFLEGENIYNTKLTNNGLLVIGNEGKGIRSEVKNLLNKKIHIPSYNSSGSESLNAAVATALCCAEFRRCI